MPRDADFVTHEMQFFEVDASAAAADAGAGAASSAAAALCAGAGTAPTFSASSIALYTASRKANSALHVCYRPQPPTPSINLNLSTSQASAATSQLHLRARHHQILERLSFIHTHAQASTLMHAHPPLQPSSIVGSVFVRWVGCLVQ